MASGEGPPPLFKALDAPAVAACVASFLYAEDSARLHASSWLLYHGVVARGTCPVLCSFKANGFGPLARFPAWLACGVQAGRDASRGGGVGTPTSRLDSSDNSHNIGIIGEIDRDVARTFPGHPLFKMPDALVGPGGAPLADAWARLPADSGARMLRSVLIAVCAARPDVQYW